MSDAAEASADSPVSKDDAHSSAGVEDSLFDFLCAFLLLEIWLFWFFCNRSRLLVTAPTHSPLNRQPLLDHYYAMCVLASPPADSLNMQTETPWWVLIYVGFIIEFLQILSFTMVRRRLNVN